MLLLKLGLIASQDRQFLAVIGDEEYVPRVCVPLASRGPYHINYTGSVQLKEPIL